MSIKCGIVGLPNVGKSTLFNTLTEAGIDAGNYPFCTIEPNVGVVAVPDHRLDVLNQLVKPQQTVPTTMQFVDIAGLVKGAADGEGLGNQFLANIRETDAIVHVVRCFENDDIVHVAGKVDPAEDIDVINTELALADLDTVDKAQQKIQKLAKSGNKQALQQLEWLTHCQQALNQLIPIRQLTLDNEAQLFLKQYQLLTAKPCMFIANTDENQPENCQHVQKVHDIAAIQHASVVTLCGQLEADIAALPAEEKQEFLQELGLSEPGLDRVIRASYALLGLKTFFTAGPKEVRAWTFTEGATAPQAAGVIHSDFERGFIRAEVTAYEDFITLGGEAAAKEKGKVRVEGKDYIVRDGDIIYFRFNV